MFTFKKYRVRRFAPSPVHVLDKLPHGERFFSPYGKNLSQCGKRERRVCKFTSITKDAN
jgi:hypothetical protein